MVISIDHGFGTLGSLKIAYAGTACSWRYRGIFEDSYNIVEFKAEKIQVDIKIVGGKRMPLSDVVKRYEFRDRTFKHRIITIIFI